jgi:hypothetical protein
MSRRKKKKTTGVLIPDLPTKADNHDKNLGPEIRNEIFQKAMRDKTFGDLHQEYGKEVSALKRICYRIATNGNAAMNDKIHFVCPKAFPPLLSLNLVAQQFIYYQMFEPKIKVHRTIEEVAACIGASVELIQDLIDSTNWGITKEKLGAFNDED